MATSHDSLYVRELAVPDVAAAKAVLHDAAWSNLSAGVRVTARKNWFHSLLLVSCAISYIMTYSWWILLLTALAVIVFIYLLNLVATLVYIYGPPLYDMNDVKQSYMSDADTQFWVAAVKENDKETIVGTIAIVPKPGAVRCTAWLRRMAVSRRWRRKGVARALLGQAVDFCRHRQYSEVQLITTDLHLPARQLYESTGFRCVAYKPYKYFRGLLRIWTYEYVLNLL